MRVALVNPPWTLRRQHLFRLPRAASAAGTRLLRGRCCEAAGTNAAGRRPSLRHDHDALAERGRGVRARHDRRRDRADLPVLALRAARTAGSARVPRALRRTRRPHGRGRARTAPSRRRRLCASSASMSWFAANARRSSRARRRRPLAAHARPCLLGGERDQGYRRAARRPLRRPPGPAGRPNGCAAITTTITASTRSRTVRAPRSRRRAAAPIAAASARRSTSATNTAGANWHRCSPRSTA